MAERRRTLVAMSGGVDSSVAAALLLERGEGEVVGVTLEMSGSSGAAEQPGSSCGGTSASDAARQVARHLGIEHHVLQASEPFERHVLQPAWEAYDSGLTPNPCVLCNRRVKLAQLLQLADRLSASQVATGHHARTTQLADGTPQLRRGVDPGKDQAYFLFALRREQLQRLELPIGGITKAEVRRLARQRGLPSAERPDSQDACFALQEQGFAETLRRALGRAARPGAIVDAAGAELGRHPGIHHFTIGQRRGLGVATGQRAYVTAIDAHSGRVTIDTDPRSLLSRGLEARGMIWHHRPHADSEVTVQVRYRHRATPATVTLLDGGERAIVEFRSPQRAVTPGQAAVLYDGDRVLGGGWIHCALRG